MAGGSAPAHNLFPPVSPPRRMNLVVPNYTFHMVVVKGSRTPSPPHLTIFHTPTIPLLHQTSSNLISSSSLLYYVPLIRIHSDKMTLIAITGTHI